MLHLKYGLDVSKEGEGWKIYKDYRNDLKRYCVDYLVGMANEKDPLIHSQALIRLREIGAKLKSKENPSSHEKELLEVVPPVIDKSSFLENPQAAKFVPKAIAEIEYEA